MIKRIISSLISVIILCSIISVVSFAEDTKIVSGGTFGADGDNLSWEIDSEGTLTVSGTGGMGYNIPWLSKKADIKKFVAEEGITAIASGAMSDCPELTEVYLPEGLRSIDSQAFYNCISLENINLPSGLEEIGDYAFNNCNSLTKIIIPESVTSIGMSAFECCVSLEEVVLPDKIESLPDHCFCDSISLKKINIPSGLKSLANKVFGYTNIETLDLTNDLEYMEYNPFYGSKSLVLKCKKDSYVHQMAIEFEVPYILADDSESFEYDNAQYNPDLAMQCARLSAASYGNYHYLPDEDIFYQMDSESNNLLDEELSRNNLGDIERGYLGNNSKENMQYTFAHKELTNNNEARDLTFVIIRGTSQENWQEITDVMKSNMTKHYAFQKNSNKLRQALEQYLKKQGINNSIVVLTGHCAGGAIANLAAHDLTQNPIDGINGNDVYGYTFAAPNCTSELNSTDNNIYNFCFTDDFFSQFPLDSWGYGKYGITYVASAQELYSTNENFKNELMNITKKTTGRDNAEFDASSTESIIDYISNIWQSIDDYYDLKSKDIEKETVNIFASSSANMSLYEYLTKYINGVMSNDAKTIQKLNSIDSSVFNPIKAYFIAGDKKYLNDTHQMYTYYSALKNECFTTLPANKTSYETISVLAAPLNYDESEISQIRQFLQTDDNAELLGWDIDDVSAWNGVEWNIDGRIKSIQLYYKNLTGSLNLSGFSGLETLICSGNKLSAINLNGCANLKRLLCDNNELASLNISGLTKLSEVNCNYNYLNNISSSMEAIIAKNGLACYNQQKIPKNALYNENELLILKNIISSADLWDLDRPNTWSCVKWHNSGGIYQCTGLDLRGLNLTGTLDLKGLNNLQYIYCSDNEYEMLDITGCENLNTIRMSGCNNINLTTDGYGAISLLEYNNNTNFSKNNAETLINICEYNEGIVKQFNQWTPSGDAIPDNIQNLKPLGKYENICTVTETNNNDGMLILNVSAEQPETISSLVLYVAEYDDNNVLSDLKEISGYIQDDSVMIYGIEIPQNTAYKLMLWDNDQYPVIDCITNM